MIDATFEDAEFTHISMYSSALGLASTRESVLHSHVTGERQLYYVMMH